MTRTDDNYQGRLRPYSRKELVAAYTGDFMSARSGSAWLQRELENYPGLMERLRELGYTPRLRNFTRAQVRAIFDAIGPP